MHSILASLLLVSTLLVISHAYNPKVVPIRFVHAVMDGPKADVYANGKLIFAGIAPGTITDYQVVYFGEHDEYRVLLVTVSGTNELYTGTKPIEVVTDGVYGDRSGYAGIYGSHKTRELIGIFIENHRAMTGFRAFYFTPTSGASVRIAVNGSDGLNYHTILQPLSSSDYNPIAGNMSINIMDMSFNMLDAIDFELDIKKKYTMYIIDDFTAATPTLTTFIAEDTIHGWVPPAQIPTQEPNQPSSDPTAAPTTPAPASSSFTIPFSFIYIFAGVCGVVFLLAVAVWAQKYRNQLTAITLAQTKGDETKQMMEKMIFSVSKYDDESSPAV